MKNRYKAPAAKPLNISDYYQPFPKQLLFHQSQAKYRLFGGAAGPGKSYALLWEAILHCLTIPGSNSLLLRRTFPQLEQGLLDHFRKFISPQLYGGVQNYNVSKHLVRFPNGSNLFFGSCQHEKDVLNYHGGEFLFIGFDELTEFTYYMWEYLTTRNRCPILGTVPTMAGATNPGEIGHAWVKALWIDRHPAPGQALHTYDAQDYEFIPALISDNPIYAQDQRYMDSLQKLSPQLRMAMLEGKWDVFANQYFDNFDRARNVISRPDQDRIIQAWWPRWISIDWGYEHHTAILWHTRGNYNGRDIALTYREVVVNHTDEDDLATLIADNTSPTEHKQMGPVYLSPDAFSRVRKNANNSVADQIADVLFKKGFHRPALADDDRVGGWRLMHSMLQDGTWLISEDCPQLIEALPFLIRDDKKREDVKKQPTIYDDVADSARYGIKSMLGSRQVPYTVQLEQHLATYEDNTSKHIASLQFQDKWKRRNQPLRRLPFRQR